MSQAIFYYNDPKAPQPDLPYQIGALAIIEKNGCILMEQRVDGGQWSLIGGGLEQQESVLECLYREILEETGLEAVSHTLYGIFSEPGRLMQFPDGHVARGIGIVFRVRVKTVEGMQCSHESLTLRWVDFAELKHLDIIAMQKKIFDCLLQGAPEPVID